MKVALEEQKMFWINPKSKYSKKYGKFPAEYIQSKTSTHLGDDLLLASAFVKLVLARFEQIDKIGEISIDEYNSLLKSERKYLQTELTKKIVMDISAILTGGQEFVTYKGVRYYSTELLDLLAKMSTDMSLELKGLQLFTNKQNEHEDQLNSIVNHFSSVDSLFKWNISNNTPILKDLVAGNVVGVVGGEKAGKTKFTMGEIVFPAFLNGKNIKIYSGEMDIEDLYSILVIKYLFTFHDFTLPYKEVRDIILLSTKIRTQRAVEKEIEYFNKIPRNIVEPVLQTLHLFKTNSKFGRLKLIRAGSEETIRSRDFYMENFERNNLSEIQNTKPEDRFDLVILDHINTFIPSENMGIEKFVQSVVRTAKNSIQPFVAVLVNHLKSDDLESISKKNITPKDLENIKLSSHGTRELEKSVTLMLLLIELKDQSKLGEITMKISATRDYNVINEFKTNVFRLIANKAVNDFCLVGHTKPAYNQLLDTNE